MTLGLPPSMMATQEFVVPRSMPMIFAMCVVLVGSSSEIGFLWALSSFCLGNDHERGTQHPVVEEIALLEHVDDGVGLAVGLDLADRLVAVRVEFLAFRVDLGDREFLEHARE